MLTRAAPVLELADEALRSGGPVTCVLGSEGDGGLVLALGLLEGLDAIDDVAVDGGAEGELDGSADERDSSGIDGLPGLDELVHDAHGRGHALLKHQGGVRES